VRLDNATLRGQPFGGKVEARFGEGVGFAGSLAFREISLPALAALALGQEPAMEGGGWSESTFAAALPADLTVQLDLRSEVLDLGCRRKPARRRCG
jgi:hypothetical protein